MKKKKNKTILVLVMLVLSIMSLSIVACKSATVDKFSKSAGTTVYVEGINKDTLFSDWRFRVGYSKGDDKIVKTTEQGLELVHDIDVNVPAKYTVKVKFNGFELSIDVRIVTKDTLLDEITGYEDNDNIKAYVSHRDYVSSGDLGSEQSEFVKTGESYFVGNLNAWSYNPAVLAKKQDGTFYTPIDFISDVKVEKKQGGNYTTLNQEDDYANFTTTVDSFGTVNLTTGEFLINQGISGEYRITRTPTSLTYPNIDQIKNNKTTLSITIIDGGYNATTALDLNQIDNSHMEHVNNADGSTPEGLRFRQDWVRLRSANNLTYLDAKAVIFHNNIELDTEYIPQELFHEDGTLDYWADIYVRNMHGVDDEFSIIGNYFNLDVSKLPLVIMERYDPIAYAHVFVFTGTVDGKVNELRAGLWTRYLEHQRGAKATVRNLSAKGNAKRSSDLKFTGGIEFIQQCGNFVELDIDNTIITDFSVGVQYFGWGAKRVLENSKIFESFNFALHCFDAGDDNYVYNSELRNSGGPLIYTAGRCGVHDDGGGWMDWDQERMAWIDNNGDKQTQNPDGSWIANKSLLNVDDKTIFDNFIDGLSPWFTNLPMLEFIAMNGVLTYIKALSRELSVLSEANGNKKDLLTSIDNKETLNLVNIVLPTTESAVLLQAATYDYDKAPFNGGIKILNQDGSIKQDFDIGANAIYQDTISSDGMQYNLSKLRPNTVISNFDTMVGDSVAHQTGDMLLTGLGNTNKDVMLGYTTIVENKNQYAVYSLLDALYTKPIKSQYDQLFGGDYLGGFVPKLGSMGLFLRWANA